MIHNRGLLFAQSFRDENRSPFRVKNIQCSNRERIERESRESRERIERESRENRESGNRKSTVHISLNQSLEIKHKLIKFTVFIVFGALRRGKEIVDFSKAR